MFMLVISVMVVDENEGENSEDKNGAAYPLEQFDSWL